jgi:ADP-ribose pyrophosphatase YjhB (NUDIX family)
MTDVDRQLSNNELWLAHPTGKLKKGEFCRSCARYNGRHVTVSVIGKKNDRVMMILRALDPQAGFWALPGGYVDWDETVEEAAKREFIEETGFTIEKLKLQNVYSSLSRDLDGRQNIDLCFRGEVGDEFSKPDQEINDCQWFEINDLPEKIAFDHRQMIEDAG